MKKSFFTIVLLAFLLSGCNVSNKQSADIAWATVNLSEVQRLMEHDAEQQNPELAEKIKSVRGSYDKKRDIRDAMYRFKRSAKSQCKKVEGKKLTEADKVRGISAYDACIFDIENLPDMVKLKQELQQVEQLADEVSSLKKLLRENIEQRSQTLLTTFSEGRYDLVLSSRQKIYYNATGNVLDVTEKFKAFVAEKNLDYSIAALTGQ